MRARQYNLLSLIAVLAALVCHFTALAKISQPAIARAEIIRNKGLPKEVAEQLFSEASIASSTGHMLFLLGVGLAISAVLFCFVSAQKNEPSTRSVSYGLLIVYTLSQFMMT